MVYDCEKSHSFSVFLFAAGYPHFLHHPVQTSTLWELRLSAVGSGGRLAHCHGLHHLDSFGCHSHIMGAAWFFHAGIVHLTFACVFICMWCHVVSIKSSCALISVCVKYSTETQAVLYTQCTGWDVQNAILREGRKRRISRHICHQFQHLRNRKTYSDELLIPLGTTTVFSWSTLVEYS